MPFMTNKVTIKTLPITFTDSLKKRSDWQLTEKIAKADLALAKNAILRDLEQNIPVKFADEIVLTLSISTSTLHIKIDYSQIKSRKTIRLIKLYLSGDQQAFSTEWIKLGV